MHQGVLSDVLWLTHWKTNIFFAITIVLELKKICLKESMLKEYTLFQTYIKSGLIKTGTIRNFELLGRHEINMKTTSFFF